MNEIKINRVVVPGDFKRTAVVAVYEGCGDSREVEVKVAVDKDWYYFPENEIDWEEWQDEAENMVADQEGVDQENTEFLRWADE